jgi:lipopolysaccharide/colanic/teichoic acid biosynthesis glycosyltransferase
MTTFYRRRGKRLLDIAGATTVLIVSSPLLLGVAATVRNRLGSPVLFKQQRPGLNGTPFTLFKFRTMRSFEIQANVDQSDTARLTPFGRWLRSTSLDELPELLNVLRGEMSLVGPRPLLMEYLDRYTPEQDQRHNVKPGITGWAQVNGRNTLTWDEKFTLDVWYVEHVSFKIDIQILWCTLIQVINRSGVTAEGHETMPEFKPKV